MPNLILIASMSNNNLIEESGSSLRDDPHNLGIVRKIIGNLPVLMGKRTYQEIGHLFNQNETMLFTEEVEPLPHGIPVTHSISDALSYFDRYHTLACISEGEMYKPAMNLAKRLEIIKSTQDATTGPSVADELKKWKSGEYRWTKECPNFEYMVYERKPEAQK